MVHNGIEYGMLAAYGEGFEILEKSEFSYDLHGLADLWLHASVVRSWLLELAERAFRDGSRTSRRFADTSTIRAKAVGPSKKRSTRASRRP